MSPRFVLGRENVPCVAKAVNRSLKADCTDFTSEIFLHLTSMHMSLFSDRLINFQAYQFKEIRHFETTE